MGDPNARITKGGVIAVSDATRMLAFCPNNSKRGREVSKYPRLGDLPNAHGNTVSFPASWYGNDLQQATSNLHQQILA
jgi:hypothetical protein